MRNTLRRARTGLDFARVLLRVGKRTLGGSQTLLWFVRRTLRDVRASLGFPKQILGVKK